MKNKQLKNWWHKASTNRVWFSSIMKGLLLSFLFFFFGCGIKEPIEEEIEPTRDLLTLDNAVLEQSNSSGEVLWKIKSARTVYSPDRQIAYLDKITGNLLKDGEVILRLKAEKGEIHKNGAEIYLKNDILAVDTRNEAVIQASSGTWYPGQELLIIEENITGTHPKMNVWANKGRYRSNKQILELEGEIVAVMADPTLKMKAEYVSWDLLQKKAIASLPPQKQSPNFRPEIYRYQAEKISERVAGDLITVDLEANTATLAKNATLKYSEPPVNITSDTATWNYEKQTVKSLVPVTVIHTTKQITITGDRGEVDLKKEIATLEGNTSGINNLDRSQLYSDRLVWKISEELVEGQGNVFYQQLDPEFQVRGSKAVGKLTNNRIVVTGNTNQPTVTNIYP
ncbi:MAG: LPS export ABC transporter periplasmic protein LptC [Prochloraceae cyanobacterium]|nr:LPS export ABC transporter periplasmic protein LptC [Prochloraceae cyanobacterium]